MNAPRTITFVLSMNVQLSGGAAFYISGFPAMAPLTLRLYFAPDSDGLKVKSCFGSSKATGDAYAVLEGGLLSVIAQPSCSLPAFSNITFGVQVCAPFHFQACESVARKGLLFQKTPAFTKYTANWWQTFIRIVVFLENQH